MNAVELAGLELHSLMVLRHGRVIAEGYWHPYRADHPQMLFSVSKSFTSTAIGFAVAEGRLTVEDKVSGFFPDDLPETVSDNLAAMRVKDLLTMATGHADEPNLWLSEDSWVRGFLANPVPHAPGSKFLYNTPATYMLSAILEKITGESLLAYLETRLFLPLGIEGATWERCPFGICTGGYGLSVKTEDIAKFGQFYLQKGVWKGVRLLPEAWFEEATHGHVSNGSEPTNDWHQGYGYQFWRCRFGAYRGDGAFGQFCIVLPEQDAVVAITSGLENMHGVIDLVWKHLLPAFAEARENSYLPVRLRALEIVVPAAAHFPADSHREFHTAENETVTLSQSGDLMTLAVGADERFEARFSTWHSASRTTSRAAWTDANTLVIRTMVNETPYVYTRMLTIDGNNLCLQTIRSCGFGTTVFPDILASS